MRCCLSSQDAVSLDTKRQTCNCYSEESVTSKRKNICLGCFSSHAIASRENWCVHWKEAFSQGASENIFTFLIPDLTPPNGAPNAPTPRLQTGMACKNKNITTMGENSWVSSQRKPCRTAPGKPPEQWNECTNSSPLPITPTSREWDTQEALSEGRERKPTLLLWTKTLPTETVTVTSQRLMI